MPSVIARLQQSSKRKSAAPSTSSPNPSNDQASATMPKWLRTISGRQLHSYTYDIASRAQRTLVKQPLVIEEKDRSQLADQLEEVEEDEAQLRDEEEALGDAVTPLEEETSALKSKYEGLHSVEQRIAERMMLCASLEHFDDTLREPDAHELLLELRAVNEQKDAAMERIAQIAEEMTSYKWDRAELLKRRAALEERRKELQVINVHAPSTSATAVRTEPRIVRVHIAQPTKIPVNGAPGSTTQPLSEQVTAPSTAAPMVRPRLVVIVRGPIRERTAQPGIDIRGSVNERPVVNAAVLPAEKRTECANIAQPTQVSANSPLSSTTQPLSEQVPAPATAALAVTRKRLVIIRGPIPQRMAQPGIDIREPVSERPAAKAARLPAEERTECSNIAQQTKTFVNGAPGSTTQPSGEKVPAPATAALAVTRKRLVIIRGPIPQRTAQPGIDIREPVSERPAANAAHRCAEIQQRPEAANAVHSSNVGSSSDPPSQVSRPLTGRSQTATTLTRPIPVSGHKPDSSASKTTSASPSWLLPTDLDPLALRDLEALERHVRASRAQKDAGGARAQRIECTVCKKCVSCYNSHLRRHMMTHLSDPQDYLYRCPIGSCPERKRTVGLLEVHVRDRHRLVLSCEMLSRAIIKENKLRHDAFLDGSAHSRPRPAGDRQLQPTTSNGFSQ